MTASSREVVENTIPVLSVADVKASIRFYCEKLGFKCDWGGDGDMSHIASVSRDGHAIMLQHRSPITPGCVWIGVCGLASLWERIRSSNEVAVVQRPTNQPWALEIKIKDPDGNILWFGSDALKGIAFGQEPTDAELRQP